MSFGPYLTGNPDHGSTVSEANLRRYLQVIAANFKSCRTFGSTAGLERFPSIAKSLGLTVTASAWLSSDLAANEEQINALIEQCQSGKVDLAVVGSETLLRGNLSEAQLLGYIARVRATGVDVSTADTWNTLKSHPQIIAACDVVMANIYPFWEGSHIDQAMSRFQNNYNQIKAVAGGKEVIISETGWPSAGGANGSAVPSPTNAARYFADFVAWANHNHVEYYYFEMFDEPWKTEPGLVGPHWGIWDSSMRLKPGFDRGFNNPTLPPIDDGITGPPFPYSPIPGVPDAVNDLGRMIGQAQRNVVTPGGTEFNPGFSSADQAQFEASDELANLVSAVENSTVFRNGVASIRTLSAETQQVVFDHYGTPIYPTWRMNGHIGPDGTTDAGYAVQLQIANAMVDAVKAAL